jgi:DNA-binding GntR family transcriptional regulator
VSVGPDDGHPYTPQRLFDNATLADRVYQTLREDILSNRLPPGSSIREADLAAALEVSRGPVREALRRLDSEGLVSVIPRRGSVVSSFSHKEFLDAYRVREVLEVLAITLAIPRLEAKHLTELERLHREMEEMAKDESVETFFSTNDAFHKLFVDRSGNPVLQSTYNTLVDQMRRYNLRSLALRGGLSRSCEEHEQILGAVKAGDIEQAAELLRQHIRVPQQILESENEAELVARKHVPDHPT